jgi:multidrug resistance efflux pump
MRENLMKFLLFPVAVYFAIYYVCYDIFWWAMIMERSPWTRNFNLHFGSATPIEDAMKFARNLVKGG